MNHQDHVNLLRKAISQPGGVWADFGSGEGAFTLALRELVGPDAHIYSIDKDEARLAQQERSFRARFPQSHVQYLPADFTRPLVLKPLDGLVMANSLHFFRDKHRLLRQCRDYLKPGGQLLLVEYNVDSGNPWVPHPLSFASFQQLARETGYCEPQLLGSVPSRFLREVYAASAARSR